MTAAATDTVASDGPAAEDSTPVAVPRSSAVWVLLAGIAGLAAALALTVEKIELLIDPNYIPTCSINPVLSCGSVMITPQASVFGFPNSLIGIISFTIVVVSGVLALANVSLPRWYWGGLAVGTLLGTVFVHWLIFQSLYRIGALCPYCMVVWAVVVPLLVVTTVLALRPQDSGNAVVRTLYTWRWSLVVLWFTAVLLLILERFWSYWSTLI
ncbi:vitamin K epoxide reductase family protein [Mycobacterium sp. pV006]|uniref:vitamin K epoxide reductase family protein n=1 Tax=Mycobacterium sp. pV006 TaxID=3238983 RepID=UPI00351BEB2C